MHKHTHTRSLFLSLDVRLYMCVITKWVFPLSRCGCVYVWVMEKGEEFECILELLLSWCRTSRRFDTVPEREGSREIYYYNFTNSPAEWGTVPDDLIHEEVT